MEDIIDIIVTETTNTIEITAQPNDEIIDVNIIDNREDIVLNVTPTVVEININSLTSNFGVEWGDITGTLADQTDLNNALALKANLVGGKVPASELPSYVDDVVEVSTFSALPATGEIGKIYVILDTNKIYRWSGSVYVEIADSTAVWGAITGTLSNQTDLQNALNAKQDDLNGTGFVKASGTTISYDNSTYALDSAVVKLAGAQTITGLKTFSGGLIANVSTGGDQGFYSINTSTSASSVFVQNNSTGIGILANNALGGDAILIGNDTSGRGIYITNATISGSGKGISIDNYNSGIGIEVGSDSSADAIKVLHLAGRAFNIQSSGGGYGVIINNTTASTSAPFTIQKQGASVITLTDAGAGTFNSSLTANSFVKTSGTSSQFLKADGSVDSSTYALDSAVVKLTGNQTVAGIKTMSNVFKLDDTLQIKNIAQLSNNTGYTGVWAETAAIGFYTGANAIRLLYAGNYNYTMPSADGTLALTSQLSSYLPLSGGTLTGALSGTSATFTGTGYSVFQGSAHLQTPASTGLSFGYNRSGANGESTIVYGAPASGFNFEIASVTSGTITPRLTITNAGAATFSSNIHIPSASSPGQGYFYFDYLSTQANSRTWRIANDYNVYGDFQIQQSTTQSGSTYSKILGFSPTGAATFSSSVTATQGNGKAFTARSGNAGQYTFIGIGRTSDDMAVGVAGSTSQFFTGSASGDAWVGATNGTIGFGNDTSGTATMIVKGGNVGIGTTAPLQTSANRTVLTVNGVAGGSAVINIGTGDTLRTYLYADSGGSTFETVGTNTISASGANIIAMNTNGTERMRITSGGAVCVNSSSATYGEIFKVANSGASANTALFYFTNTNDRANIISRHDGSLSTNSREHIVFINGNGVGVGSITANGSATSYNITSDYRLKEDLKPINGLDIVNKIKVYDYKWKSANIRMDGVLAHELAEVLPYAVSGVKDGEQMQGVDYSKIVPVMVQAIKDLKAKIETLENK